VELSLVLSRGLIARHGGIAVLVLSALLRGFPITFQAVLFGQLQFAASLPQIESTTSLRDPTTWVIGRTLLAILLLSALLVQKGHARSRKPDAISLLHWFWWF
jgi:hypothetical protein